MEINMDLIELLEQNGIDVTSVRQMIADRRYKDLYRSYPDAVEFMCFVTSEYEFDDFIADQKSIDEEAFLLALAASRSLCSCFGVNEEDEMKAYLESLKSGYNVLFTDKYHEGSYYIFPSCSNDQ